MDGWTDNFFILSVRIEGIKSKSREDKLKEKRRREEGKEQVSDGDGERDDRGSRTRW